MKEMTDQERSFFTGLLNYSARLINGYYRFQPRNLKYGNKKYKRSRVIMQLHLNCILEPWEIVHHKNGVKTDDSIDNLEVQISGDHASYHHAGKHKIGKFSPANKLSKEKVKSIIDYCKGNLKKDGNPNFSEVGRILGISGFTVAHYWKKEKIEQIEPTFNPK